uniref:FH2 domain-containing protein 1-like n=1 Tax=Sinocyclocheilus grahami TaxID=75366 RepID=A0A672LNJ8_SINGR
NAHHKINYTILKTLFQSVTDWLHFILRCPCYSISILDSKRGMNIGIFLKQFKKSNHAIVEDIRLGNSKQYGAEPLKELLKLLPEAQERLREFKGDPNKLTLVDSFMFLLIQVPCYEVRIEAMVLQEEFLPSCAVMNHEINIVRRATEELMACEELHAILHLVLQAGNIMNAGGYAGNAVGFNLSSLLSLADTKANKPGMNLLHFVALEAQKKDEALLKFPEKLTHVQSAVRISVENIEGEFSSLYVKTRSLEQKIQDDGELQQQLDPFLQSSTQALQDLKHRRLDLRKEGNALIDFFCEDKDTFKLDECFRIFQDFCLKFRKAVKDNLDREQKEEARQRRLQELEERRCAWGAANAEAGGSGGFGRSSSENDVDILTKEGLLDFLIQSRPQSPHSPLGRSASAHRYHHTELISASTASDYTKFSSLPRSGRNHQRKTMAWLLLQDDNRELDPQSQAYQEKLVSSPKAETEPISPLARYSSFGYSTNNNPYHNNNNNTSLSESGVTPQISNTKHGTSGQSVGHMSVSVEKHKLVPGLQPFEITSQINNNSHVSVDNQREVFVTDLERDEDSPKAFVLDTPPSSRSSEEGPKPEKLWNDKMISSQREEADSSTFSSTTCDTPLPLDPPVSGKKPVLYVMDCTETDCSIVLDCSEIESSPIIKERSELSPKPQEANFSRVIQDTNSLSSNFESTDCHFVSTSSDEPLVGRVNRACPESVSPSVTTEEAETDSCDTAEGRRVGEKAFQTGSPKATLVKTKIPSKAIAHASRPTRTLTATETQNMRKVVPITRQNRSSSSIRKVEKPPGHENIVPRRPIRDQSMPARRGERQGRPTRHSSLPPEDPRAPRGATPSTSRWVRDSAQHRPSIKKTNAKTVRNISKPAPEEKMCRSTMRALAQAQAQGTSEGGTPDSPSNIPKSSSPLPSFARNTVASSSRTKKDLPSPAVTGTPSKNLSRSSSQRLPGGRTDSVSSVPLPRSEDKPIRRVQSVRASSRISETPPSQSGQERSLKSSSFSERSIQIRDSILSRTNKPTWK